ncbi:hypothetical protein Ddye_017447 [Dipteronia dyeriana]|uniref:MULE transposase domain-containing protein n=1 Tax=Dipteronia dyeriana TaxID=168575 RepID=A0AAD9U9D6_9ROSI|nr:hypothetical protein Ddye_017447 [Dipteronia dyeriana]
MDNCIWKLRAVRRDKATYFHVRSFINEHTCPLEEVHRCHRQASAVIIGEVVAPRLQQHDGRLMQPNDIIADMKTMYGIQIMYNKAYQALDYALSLTYGTHEETFQKKKISEQSLTYSATKMVNLSTFSCRWVPHLEDSGGAIGHIDDLVLISDHHASIKAGISKVFPYATHTICCWHFYENFKKRYHIKDVATIMDKAARAYTELEYNRHMEELRNLHPNAYYYAIDADPHKWSRVHCPNKRYRVMTTNAAECINSCLKFARQLPILTLTEFIRNMLQRWFHDRHIVTQSMPHQLTDATHLVILKRVEKCNFMIVNPVDWNIFSVKRSGK